MKTIVYGGSGSLGRAVVKKMKNYYDIINIDYVKNNEASMNIILDNK